MRTILPAVRAEAEVAWQAEPMLVALRDPVTDRSAVDWAAHRAVSLDVPLTLLHAVADPSLMVPGTSYGDEVVAGRALVNGEATRVSLDRPGLRVGTYVHCGDVVEALLGLSAVAPLIVVGADRKDAVSGEFRGSVALQVALNSSAPVVVVPPSPTRTSSVADDGTGGVVVGVDGSQVSRTVLIRAAGEAHLAGTTLTVVTALGSSPERMAVGASAMLLDVGTRFPQLPVRWIVDDIRTPVQALSFHGAGADLLVIGRHGSGARSAMSLGSVTHLLLLEPPCPTVVLTCPEPDRSARPTDGPGLPPDPWLARTTDHAERAPERNEDGAQ